MNVIIAGSRNITEYSHVLEAIARSCIEVTKVISGMARGVDRLALQYAHEKRLPVIKMPADWDTHGRRAGYRRNEAMAEIADAVIAVWDGKSKGTKHMIDIAQKRGLMTYVHNINDTSVQDSTNKSYHKCLLCGSNVVATDGIIARCSKCDSGIGGGGGK